MVKARETVCLFTPMMPLASVWPLQMASPGGQSGLGLSQYSASRRMNRRLAMGFEVAASMTAMTGVSVEAFVSEAVEMRLRAFAAEVVRRKESEDEMFG